MRKIIIIFLVVLIQLPLIAQINKNGIPFIKNFTKDDYHAAEQNWAICQDNRGVMYFGNNDVILEFDGVTWKSIPVSNNSIIRSLAVDSLGTIYVGAVGEFGYLSPDINGKMQYISLYNKSYDTLNVKDVWKTYVKNNEVYYCAESKVFKFKDKKFEKLYIEKGGFISFYFNNKLILGNYSSGLLELINNQFSVIKGGEFYKEKDVYVILPLNKKELFIGTMVQGKDFYIPGNYIYNLETGESKNISNYSEKFKKLSVFLQDAQIYNGIQLKNGNYALTTVNDGLIIINNQGDIINYISKENGLFDNTVTNAFESKEGNLWLSLFNSISYIEINSPFLKFDSKNGIEGMILDVERFNGTLYIATSLGLYYQYINSNGLPYFKLVNGLDKMVWTLNKIKTNDDKERLLAGTAINVYEIYGIDKIKVIKDENNNEIEPKEDLIDCYSIYQSKFDNNKIYITYKNGLTYIDFINGKWSRKINRFENFAEPIEAITQDENGNLWLATVLNGIYKLNPDNGVFSKYGIENGLPYLDGNKVISIKNDILFSTKKGIYYFNKTNNKIEKYDKLTGFYNRTDKVTGIFQENDSVIWVISKIVDEKNSKESIEIVEKVVTNNNETKIYKFPFQRIKKQSFFNVSFDSDNNIWFSSLLAAINYNIYKPFETTEVYYSLNRDVTIQFDSIIFNGTYYMDTNSYVVSLKQPDILKRTLNYKNNSLIFNFSSPYSPVDELKYSYKLEGFEREWSNWDTKTEKEYTNLNEGSYNFKVKALNIYGIESEVAEYKFNILPPWYWTIWAYMLYFIIAIAIIVIIVKLYTRKLRLEKIRLEQIVKERTEEVVKQKDEILLQRDEIAGKNKSITDSIEYAKRIQNAVLPSKELAQEILPEHFILFRPRDIVSGDFYWFTKKDNLLIIIAADCTGHGVPGAFMSMLGVSFINEIVNKHDVIYAGDILTHLRSDVKRTLSQTGKEGEAKDGMDIALCIVDIENMKMQYAGAYNPMYMFRNNELIEYKADRMPIGIYVKEKDSFTNNVIDIQKGDVFYLFSDGYHDQFGGEDGQKYKTKSFKEYLLEIHQKPMADQRELLNLNIDKWRGKWEQVDDICVIGVRI